MPLNLQFLRDDTPRTMPNGFGHWHLGVALCAGAIEEARRRHVRIPDVSVDTSHPDFDYASKLGWAAYNHGKVVITKPIAFSDPTDGEVLDLEVGDEIRMWR